MAGGGWPNIYKFDWTCFFITISNLLGEGNLIFHCAGSRENYFESVGAVGKIIILILSFSAGLSKNKNIDHRGQKTCNMFVLPIQNKNSTINVSLPKYFIKKCLILLFSHNYSTFTKFTLF